MCIYCKSYAHNRKVLEFAKCKDEVTKHRLVEACAMCQFCQELSDTVESLENTPCPKRLDFNEESGKVEQRGKTPLPVVKPPSQHASEAIFEMEKANKEIKRLQVLKAMAVERERLAELIARRNRSCFLFAKIEIPPFLLQVQLETYAWLVCETLSFPSKRNDA